MDNHVKKQRRRDAKYGIVRYEVRVHRDDKIRVREYARKLLIQRTKGIRV